MLPWPGPLALKVTFGRSLMTSSKVVIVIWASESPVSAWIVIGTFWTDSARRCAESVQNVPITIRSEEHTSELQSQSNLVCRLLLEKKKEIVRQLRRVELAGDPSRRDQGLDLGGEDAVPAAPGLHERPDAHEVPGQEEAPLPPVPSR